MTPSISIHLVVSNAGSFLPDFFASLEKQTFRDFQVLVIDNGSTDGTEAYVRETFPHVRFLRNARNLGLSAAYNQGIRYALDRDAETDLHNTFILVLSPDILLEPTFLEHILSSAMQQEKGGSFGGTLFCAYREALEGDETLVDTTYSDRVDSAGLVFHKNFTFSKNGIGSLRTESPGEPSRLFGFSDSCVLYRASALQAITQEDGCFDQDLSRAFADVDLAFRLQEAGFEAWISPKAIAYRQCGSFRDERPLSLFARMRMYQPSKKDYWAIRNRWLLRIKHQDAISAWFFSPWHFLIMLFQLISFMRLDTVSTKACFDALVIAPKMLRKRFMQNKRLSVSRRKIRKQFAL